MRDDAVLQHRNHDGENRSAGQRADEHARDHRPLRSDHFRIGGQNGQRQRCSPGNARVDELLARQIAQHEVLAEESAHLQGLPVEHFKLAAADARRGRQGSQRRLEADKVPVDEGGDLLGLLEGLVLEAGALRRRIAPGENRRERQHRHKQGQDEQHEMRARR